MLAFKVVDGKTRYGSNITMFSNINNVSVNRLERYIISNDLSEYIFKYDIGKEIKAMPDSPGIMCFYTYQDAKNFFHEHSKALYSAIIIEVEGKELMNCDFFYGNLSCGDYPSRIKSLNRKVKIKVPGLVTFKKVTVLN